MLRSKVRDLLTPSMRLAIRQLLDEIRIDRMHRRAAREAARRFSGAERQRLNLGSGHHPKPGWINVDLFAPNADLRLDLRRPLPFRDSSVSYIYSEHLFEHLEYPNVYDSLGWDFQGPGRPSEALTFLAECRRVLTSDGILDVVVPDTEGMIGTYVSRHERAFRPDEWWGPKWCTTPMHRVNYLFRQGREHKYAYDEETLRAVMEEAGFHHIARRLFDPAMDAPNHVIGSMCMTARK
jgi:predicted SAM-dependent methyltransferase